MTPLDQQYAMYVGSPETELPRLLDVLRRTVRRVASRYTVRQDTIEDVVSAIWERLGQYDAGRGSFTAWVWMTARHLIIDHLRTEQRQPVDYVEVIREPRQEESERSTRDWSALPPEIRRIANRLAAGYTVQEIAEELGVSPATVRRRVANYVRCLDYQTPVRECSTTEDQNSQIKIGLSQN